MALDGEVARHREVWPFKSSIGPDLERLSSNFLPSTTSEQAATTPRLFGEPQEAAA